MYTASKQDGGGTVVVAPHTVFVGKPCTLTFTYTTGPEGIATGGGVLCQVTRFWDWAPPQGASPQQPGYSTVTCSSEAAVLAVNVDPEGQTILARIQSGRLTPGDTLLFTYGDTSQGQYPDARGIADRYAEHGERFFFKVDGDGDEWFTPIAEQPAFDVLATDAARFAVFGPSRAEVGKPFELRVSALDAENNLVESYAGQVEVLTDGEYAGGATFATFGPDDRGSKGIPFTPTQAGITRLAARSADGTVQGVSNILVFHDREPSQYTLYWADLQIHGNLSDGTGTPDDIYRYARDVARLDAAALTEHDYWGYLPLVHNAEGWRSCIDASRTYNQPGRFVAFPAYEWTNWTFGHMHVLFAREEEAAVFAWNDPQSDRPEKLWRLLEGKDCLTIPHHCGGGPIPTCWKYYNPAYQPVAEVVSIHGVSERMGQPGCIYRPVESGMVQSALARGYRLGMIGSGDTHDGHPGIGSPGSPPPGLAGIYAERLTRDSILAAIRARRAYATNGCRAILRFHSGDTPMGGTIQLAAPTTPRTFDVLVVGDAPIASVTIVRNNVDVAAFEGSSIVESQTWQDETPARDGDCYYVRIAQVDGGWIWSSPIWVECKRTKDE